MDESLKKSLLQSIELSGSVSVENSSASITVNGELSNVLDKSSGKPRIRPAKVSQFHLILSQPVSLLALSPFEIRCLHCKRVISYPSWWLQVKFDRNILVYFVCFSETSPNRVSLDCKR